MFFIEKTRVALYIFGAVYLIIFLVKKLYRKRAEKELAERGLFVGKDQDLFESKKAIPGLEIGMIYLLFNTVLPSKDDLICMCLLLFVCFLSLAVGINKIYKMLKVIYKKLQQEKPENE